MYELHPWHHQGRPPEAAASDLRASLAAGGAAPWNIFEQTRGPGNFLRNEEGQVFAIDVLPLTATGKLLAYALGL